MLTSKEVKIQKECLELGGHFWKEKDNGWVEDLTTGLFDHVVYTHSRTCTKCKRTEHEARGDCTCSLCAIA